MDEVRLSEHHLIPPLTLAIRVAAEEKLGPRLKEVGVLPDHRHDRTFNIRSDLPFSAVRSLSPKRPREEGDGEVGPPPLESGASKRIRVQ